MSYAVGIVLILVGVALIVGNLVRSASELIPEPEIEIHVRYNSITDGNSKYKEPRTGRCVLAGEHRGVFYRCFVSEQLWDAVGENTHVRIPVNLCERIEP